jgi:general nucleoside transport system permease protein
VNATKVVRNVAQALLAPLIAVIVSAAVTSIVVVVAGASVGDFFDVMMKVPSHRNLVNITNQSSLIFLAALAAAIGFRMNLFNIGVEGQYTLAAYAAALVAGQAWFPGKVNILVALIVAMVVGAVWAGIAGLLKVTRGVSEVISTIMLNAIAGTIVGYLLSNHGQQYGQGRRTTPIPESSQLSGWTPWAAGDGSIWTLVILAALAGVVMSVVINRTRFGFDLRATGLSQSAAVASGVDAKRMVVIAMCMSGAIAGLVGMPQLLGGSYSYSLDFPTGIGFTGIGIALLGRNSPVGIAFASLLWAFLDQSSQILDFNDIPKEIVAITQAAVLLSVVIVYEVVNRVGQRIDQRHVAAQLGEVPA